MNIPQMSVVVPTLGRSAELNTCLAALLKQEGADLEVIVVTNAKEQLQRRLEGSIKENASVRVLEQKEQGLAAARNLGLSNARGKIVTFIDDDVVVLSVWAAQVISVFDSSGEIGGVSGPTIIPEDLLDNRDILFFHNQKNPLWRIINKIYTFFVLENQSFAVGRIFKSGAFSLGANYARSSQLKEPLEVDYLEACNMSFRKDILDDIGGFSREYGGIGDWSEPDLAFRVKASGYKLVFNPKAVVRHCISQGGVFKERGSDSYRRMKNFINFYFKWIKPNTLEKFIRFSINLTFLNLYWFYSLW